MFNSCSGFSVLGYATMQSAQRRSKKVKVWVRTRPTANFAHENIDLQSDGKVCCPHLVFALIHTAVFFHAATANSNTHVCSTAIQGWPIYPTLKQILHICLSCTFQTVDIHCTRDPRKGAVNNQVVDWSFRVDGVLHNASQETVYNTTSAKLLNAALNGYNGTSHQLNTLMWLYSDLHSVQPISCTQVSFHEIFVCFRHSDVLRTDRCRKNIHHDGSDRKLSASGYSAAFPGAALPAD